MCIDEAWDECVNLSIMQSWKLQKLEIERQHDIQVNKHLDNNISSQWLCTYANIGECMLLVRMAYVQNVREHIQFEVHVYLPSNIASSKLTLDPCKECVQLRLSQRAYGVSSYNHVCVLHFLLNYAMYEVIDQIV